MQATAGAGVSEPIRVFVCSGHMIDAPNRKVSRFPAEMEARVRALIAEQLSMWSVSKDDFALSGGARGADMLFAEECMQRGTPVRLLVALPDAEFIERSVRVPGTDYEARYRALRKRCETQFQQEKLGPVPDGADVFSRNNIWMIDAARALTEPERIFALLVWDEKPTGDGPGGTSDFARRIAESGGHVAIINPLRL
jgi:hypothetical protein